jgi:16S rRNA (cytosine967-C5)-methyltransferase
MSPRRPTARSVALDVLGRVIDEGAYSNRALPAALGRSGLDARDRAFATALALGTLRRRLPLDAAIEGAAHRPIGRITPAAGNALRLGAFQLLDGNVPAHAAVAETVDLVGARERGFVNAVLRRLANEPPPRPPGDDPASIAARTGLARWAVDELVTVVGDEAADAAAALAEQGPLSLRAIGGGASLPDLIEELRAGGLDPTPGAIDPACITLPRGDPRAIPAFREGRVTVQDQSSAYVGRLVGARPGDRVYDVCAAPGGKTLHLAELTGPTGRVLAADRSATRIGLVAGAAARTRLHPWLVVQDAVAAAVDSDFDGVLVDAPCSGLGSARRRPELLWRVSRDRLATLSARQLAIATGAADRVRPGGRFVYAVCTFTRAETDAVCDALLRTRPEFEELVTAGPDGVVARHRLWPHRLGSDGMFAAAFRRRP